MPMPPPPPPGLPGPPPPPITGFKLTSGKTSRGDGRSELLQSIQKGKQLKKTITNDKSGPDIAGKVISRGDVGVTAIEHQIQSKSQNVTASSNVEIQKLGGLFEGMCTMPKLKPVGTSRIGPLSNSSAPSNRPTSGTNIIKHSAVLDFNTELTQHLTLKKQRKQQQQGIQPQTTETKPILNRGPPPYPPNICLPEKPIVNTTPTVHILKQQPNITNKKGPSPVTASGIVSPPPNDLLLSPNKSTLFPNDASTNNSDNNTSNIFLQNSGTLKTNHKKPNRAPKPPGIQHIISTKTKISRHHSMRSPKTLSITTTVDSVFPPSVQHFGTTRGPPQMFQSQDSLNSTVTRQAPILPISRPTVAPPRPPNIKPLVNNTHNNDINSYSYGMNTSRDRNINVNPPPLPPHRTCPALPPPPQGQTNPSQLTSTNPTIPPPPPQRYSSIRNSTNSIASTTIAYKSQNVNNQKTIDIDAKFGHLFHNVTEFPPPSPFTNLPKSYPSLKPRA